MAWINWRTSKGTGLIIKTKINMKKISVILLLLSGIAHAQIPVSRATLKTVPYGWIQRVVPPAVQLGNTFASFYHKLDDPATGTGSLVLSSGPTITNSLTIQTGTSSVITASGNVTATGTILAANLLSGTYTPTLTNTTNVSTSTAYATGYFRVGNAVTVYGKVDIDATAAGGASTELQVSLPISTNMAAEQDLGGNASSDALASLSARIKGDATTDQASIVFKALSITNDSYSFSFTYQIK
jgi:hypothetical protein